MNTCYFITYLHSFLGYALCFHRFFPFIFLGSQYTDAHMSWSTEFPISPICYLRNVAFLLSSILIPVLFLGLSLLWERGFHHFFHFFFFFYIQLASCFFGFQKGMKSAKNNSYITYIPWTCLFAKTFAPTLCIPLYSTLLLPISSMGAPVGTELEFFGLLSGFC